MGRMTIIKTNKIVGDITMAEHEIFIRFDLNEKQEHVIEAVMKKLDGNFNYISADVLNFIIHDKLFYEFMDEKRSEYDDLIEPIFKGIEEHEYSLFKF